MVPNLFGTKYRFRGRQFYHRQEGRGGGGGGGGASGDEASSGAMGSGRGRQAGSPADRLMNQSAVGRGGPPGSAASSIVRLLDSVANRPTPA